jgi:hypothetical protein
MLNTLIFQLKVTLVQITQGLCVSSIFADFHRFEIVMDLLVILEQLLVSRRKFKLLSGLV